MTQDWMATLAQATHTPGTQAKVRVILLGLPADVNSVIYDLYQRGFADVNSWSPAQIIPDSDEIIRVNIRRFGRS